MLNKVYYNSKNLVENVQQVQKNNPNSMICAMVKANAYGIGTAFAVKTLSPYVHFFGVATQKEAEKVEKFTSKKILIVGPLERTNKINSRFSYTCHCLEDVEFLASLNKKLNIHIKVNSGMNRYGFSNKQEFSKALTIIQGSKLLFEGIFTHFATDDDFVESQLNVFKKYLTLTKKFGFNPIVHVDNSIVNQKKNHHKSMVRIGFDLYNKNNFYFKPVVSIKSSIVQINQCKKGDLVGYDYKYVCPTRKTIAVVPVGYSDGFSKSYIGTNISFKGKKCSVLNVCMDCFMIDITNIKTKKGDEIFILDENNPLKIYANHSNISEYEVMCKFSHIRATRKYI